MLSLLGTSLGIGFYFFPKVPLSTQSTVIECEFYPGSSVKAILKQLRSHGVLSFYQSFLFRLYIASQHAEKKIQAGEYCIAKNATPEALLQKWIKGEVILYPITFPEGITVKSALSILEKHPKIKQSSILFTAEKEGTYYPETYYFPANTSGEAILKMAQSMMEKKLANAWRQRDPSVVLKTPYEALILASIIEKETSNEQEKPIISGIFQRRLIKKMRLQADPTVVYGLSFFNGHLTKKDLQSPTPYNTYVNFGLPPTPIAWPGMRSIEAALDPDKSDYLYFVAKGDGTHHFSATLQEHNKAVKQYQKEKALCNLAN